MPRISTALPLSAERISRTPESSSEIFGEGVKVGFRCARFQIDHEIDRFGCEAERRSLPAINLANPPLQAVPNGGFPDPLRSRDSDPWMSEIVTFRKDHRVPDEGPVTLFICAEELAPPGNPLLPRQRLRCGTVWSGGSRHRHPRYEESGTAQTARRLRPLRRRREMTAWPFFVLIRTRKPCVRFRRRLFG